MVEKVCMSKLTLCRLAALSSGFERSSDKRYRANEDEVPKHATVTL